MSNYQRLVMVWRGSSMIRFRRSVLHTYMFGRSTGNSYSSNLNFLSNAYLHLHHSGKSSLDINKPYMRSLFSTRTTIFGNIYKGRRSRKTSPISHLWQERIHLLRKRTSIPCKSGTRRLHFKNGYVRNIIYNS